MHQMYILLIIIIINMVMWNNCIVHSMYKIHIVGIDIYINMIVVLVRVIIEENKDRCTMMIH